MLQDASLIICSTVHYSNSISDKRFVFGNTYGDTTRGLDVCSHNAPSFGEFTKMKASQSIAA